VLEFGTLRDGNLPSRSHDVALSRLRVKALWRAGWSGEFQSVVAQSSAELKTRTMQ